MKPRGASNRHASWCERGSCNSPYSIWYNCIVKFAERFVAALFLALVGSAFADGEATSTTTVTVDTTETGAKFYKAEIK